AIQNIRMTFLVIWFMSTSMVHFQWPRELPCATQCTPLPEQLHFQLFLGQDQGLWLLLQHHQHWTLTETSLRYPTLALSNGDPAVMVLLDQSLLTPQQVIDGINVGVGQLKALDVDLGDS
ncbi:hypothetical protein STEG23_017079, partial [Scotinomys teguina]